MAKRKRRVIRCLGRARIAAIKAKCPPAGITDEEWVSLCRMAELYRQNLRRIKRSRRKPTKPDDQDKYLSEAECGKLLSFLRDRAFLERARGLRSSRAITTELAVLLMVGAGLRVSEVCDLKLLVNVDAVRDGKLRLLGKGVKKRTVALGPYLKMRLQNYCGFRAERKRLTAKSPLLINEKGKAFNRNTIYSRIKTAGKMAGIRRCRRRDGTRLHNHMLRHTHGTYLLDETGDSKVVRDQLGHTHEVTTDNYARTFSDRRAPALARVEKRLYGMKKDEVGLFSQQNIQKVKKKP